MSVNLDFETIRAEWAMKYTPTKDRIDLEFKLDQSRNPHNDNYHNKAPRREEAQIVSDLCYIFADRVLTQQYGRHYTEWLNQDHKEDPFTKVWKRAARF